jgi:hypothetical protein
VARIRRAALDLLTVLGELEERVRIPLLDDACDAGSDRSSQRGCSAVLESTLDDASARERLCIWAITTAYLASRSGQGGGGWKALSCQASVRVESIS